MPIALAAHGVSHRFGGVQALQDVSLDIPAGSAVALVGQSGSGKTTLLRCFNRMVDADSGEVLVGGASTRTTDATALRRRLGYVQQRGGLLPHWTVAENVGLVLRAAGADGRARIAAVSRALDLLGLDRGRFGERYPYQLSGGQQQRVALARALASDPDAILLDEPFGALDAITRSEMQEVFLGVRRSLGLTTLLVTHDLAEAALVADTIAVMKDGRVEQAGTMRALKDSPATAYVRDLVARSMRAASELLGGPRA